LARVTERTRLRSIQFFNANIRNLMIKRRAKAAALLYSTKYLASSF